MNLDSPTEPHALAKMTREGRMMDFDIGEIESSDGELFGFSIIAGAGYDATIMKGASAGKKLLGPMAYFTSAVTHVTPQHARFTLTIDGKKVESEGVGVLIVNFSKIQFDLSLVHNNLPRDGMFDIVVLNTKDAFGLIPALVACILDQVRASFPTEPTRWKSTEDERSPSKAILPCSCNTTEKSPAERPPSPCACCRRRRGSSSRRTASKATRRIRTNPRRQRAPANEHVAGARVIDSAFTDYRADVEASPSSPGASSTVTSAAVSSSGSLNTLPACSESAMSSLKDPASSPAMGIMT